MTAQIDLRSRNERPLLLERARDHVPHSLRRMQSRGLVSMVFDNTLLSLKFCFDRFADAMAVLMAGILTPKQARSVSIYLTAFLIAILMLVFCRELNLYCFRSVARNESASAPRVRLENSMLSKIQNNSAL